MRILRRSELKGILTILLLVLALATTLLALTGKLQKHTGLRLSLGGTFDKIVFVSDRSGTHDIWIMDADGSNQRALTNDEFRDAQPAWSPDGKRLLFTSNRGDATMQVFVMHPDGSKRRQVTSSVGSKAYPSFSPNGFDIVYLTGGRVFTVDTTGGHEEPILPTREDMEIIRMADENLPYRMVSWAADSRRLGAIQEISGIQVVQVIDRPGERPRVVNDLDEIPMAAERASIAWSKSGLKLAMALATTRKQHLLAVWDIENERFRRLFEMAGDQGPDAPDWSPDGEKLAFGIIKIGSEGQSEPAGVVIVDTSDGTIIPVENGPGGDPRWSPDGKSLLYVLKENGKSDIWKFDLATEESTNLTGGSGRNTSPAWGPTRRGSDA